jgi:hypothetical protein
MGDFSYFLFARPSFWEGASRAIDLGGVFTEYNESLYGGMADDLAMWSDWCAVADDFKQALKKASENPAAHGFIKER